MMDATNIFMAVQPRNFSRRQAVACFAGLVGASFSAVVNAAEPVEHPLTRPIAHARACKEKAEAMAAYETTFVKREVVGRSLISQQMRMKVRHNPFSVYMYFESPSEGREVIFVEGRNNNNLLVHETGFAGLIGTLELSPTGSQVMAENRYPITKAGIANMVQAVIEQWETELKYGEIEVKYYKDAKVAEHTCRVIESIHPQPRKQFPFHITRLWIDDATGLPVRVQQLGFPATADAKPPVIEDYTFTKIQADVRLTDRDFDVNNPSYRF